MVRRCLCNILCNFSWLLQDSLQKDFGAKTGEMLWNYSRGIDNRLVGVIQVWQRAWFGLYSWDSLIAYVLLHSIEMYLFWLVLLLLELLSISIHEDCCSSFAYMNIIWHVSVFNLLSLLLCCLPLDKNHSDWFINGKITSLWNWSWSYSPCSVCKRSLLESTPCLILFKTFVWYYKMQARLVEKCIAF